MKKSILFIALSLLCTHGLLYAQDGNHQPYVNYWYPDSLLNWNPATDTSAPFNKGTIPLATRFFDTTTHPCTTVNTRNTNLKIAALSSLHSTTSFDPSQGYDHADEYTFGYWQYLDYLVMWGGSAGEGLILAPPSPYINAAHRNGVKIMGNIFFPPNVYGGEIQWVNDLLQQDSAGDFIVADKLIEAANYYGFDGYFINQETTGGNTATATKMSAFMKYFQTHKTANMEIMWYDAMDKTGAVGYQNALNANNVTLFESNDSVASNSIFLNYGWSSSGLTSSATEATSVGRSPYDVYAGIDVSENGYGTNANWTYIFPTVATPKVSVGLFNPNWTFGASPNQSNIPLFYQREEEFWLGANGSPCSIPTTGWPGFAKYYNEKSVVNSWPFITRFNTGQGTNGFWVAGNQVSTAPWNNLSAQDILPTWRWIATSTGTPLTVGLDFTTAYNGGNSILVSGALGSTNTTLVKLYSTQLPVTSASTLSITFKTNATGSSDMQVALAFADAPNTYVYLSCNDTSTGWQTTMLSLSAYAGQTISSIGLSFASTTTASNYTMNVGEIALLNATSAVPAAPAGMTMTTYLNCENAELDLMYDTSTSSNIWYYDIYRVRPDNSMQWLGRTPDNAFYVKNIKRIDDEATTNIAIVAVNTSGMSSVPLLQSFTWPSNPTNYALSMNGTTQYVSTGDIDLDSNNITMEGYVNVSAFKTATPYISSIMGIDSAQNTALLRIGNAAIGANKVQFSLNIDSTVQTLTSNATLNAATWYQIAGTYDGAYMRLYINGVIDDSMAATGYVKASGPFQIGMDTVASASSYLNGMVDEMRVWSVARTEEEISDNECSVSTLSDSLTAYWTFNDCGTTIPYDNSGNNHDGVTANMTSANWVTPGPCINEGIPNVTNANEIKLYPNPVSEGNNLTLEIPANATAQCYIYDETGALVHKQDIYQQQSTINVARLSNGVYFYKVICNEQTFTGKVVILQ